MNPKDNSCASGAGRLNGFSDVFAHRQFPGGKNLKGFWRLRNSSRLLLRGGTQTPVAVLALLQDSQNLFRFLPEIANSLSPRLNHSEKK
jgi:hypothetical protein